MGAHLHAYIRNTLRMRRSLRPGLSRQPLT